MQATRIADEVWSVRPLTRVRRDGTPYRREATVEAQVRELSSLPERVRRERIGIADRGHPDRVTEEALVYLFREYMARGDDDTAWRIAELLVERVSGHVRRELGCWRMTAEEMDECARDLFAALWEALLDTGPAAEFWEVRFWVCLDRRLWNLAEKRQAASDAEVRFSDREESDGERDEDPLLRVADTDPGPEALAEYREALDLLAENERMAVYLRYVEGWPEESDDPERPSIARALGVTGRSVRNYLRRAETKLKAWQAGGERAG